MWKFCYAVNADGRNVDFYKVEEEDREYDRIPATNCFCIRKKINAVGIVEITIAVIIIP